MGSIFTPQNKGLPVLFYIFTAHSLLMRPIDSLLNEYGESHQNKTNKLIHWICVPVIFWTITGLLWGIKFPFTIPIIEIPFNAAMLALLLAIAYYIRLSIPLAIALLGFSIICLYISYIIDTNLWPGKVWLVSLIAFVIAWIFQFIGHNIEGKKPSFLKDLQFLLVGPAWLMHFIFKKVGIQY